MPIVWVFIFIILSGAANAVEPTKNDPPGTSYPSQKLSYSDPKSKKVVWRMTVDGTQFNALNNLRDATAMEGNSFSPDNRSICYAKSGHTKKPDGIYIMDIASGIETFVGSRGLKWGSCAWSKIANELYVYNSPSSTITELQAVNLSTFNARLIKTFNGVYTINSGLSVNKDGSYILVMVSHKVDSNFQNNEVHFVILKPDGTEHPNWKFNLSDTPDMAAAGDTPYWSPVDPKVIRIHRNGNLGVYNIDTALKVPVPERLGFGTSSSPSSHACWTVDGKILFHSFGHADCHPLQLGRGDSTEVAIERQIGYPFIWITAMKNALNNDSIPPSTDIVAVHFSFSATTDNWAHPHTQFSRDAKYLLFASDVTNVPSGMSPPPGGADNNSRTVDLFIVPLAGTTGTTLSAPKNLVAK